MKILKKQSHKLLYSLLFIVVMNCSNSHEVSPPLVGVWSLNSVTKSGCTNTSDNIVQTYSCPADNTHQCGKITFNSNGTYSEDYSYINSSNTTTTESIGGTYSTSGNSLILTQTSSSSGTVSPPQVDTVTYVLSASSLTLSTPKDKSTGCVTTNVLAK